MATQKDLSSAASGVTERIKQDSKQKLDSTKRSAADQIEEVARALNSAGEQLNRTQPTVANYAGQMADTVSRFATKLRDGNIDELLNETRELARRNPGVFLAGGVALGFALSRFLKASGEQRATQYSGQDYAGDYTGEYTSGEYGGDEPSSGGSYGQTLQRTAQEPTTDLNSTTYSGSSGTRDEYSTSRTNGG